jgi:hypothetical protein
MIMMMMSDEGLGEKTYQNLQAEEIRFSVSGSHSDDEKAGSCPRTGAGRRTPDAVTTASAITAATGTA